MKSLQQNKYLGMDEKSKSYQELMENMQFW